MTDTSTTTSALAVDDPRQAFATAVATGGRAIAAVRIDQLDGPTPCTEFDVRTLLGHLVMVLYRVGAVGRGESPMSVAAPTDIADDGWLDAWTAAAHRVQEAWTDPATLDGTYVFPWRTMDGRQVMAQYTNEVVVHTWDLAMATGVPVQWDEHLLEVTYAGAVAALKPTDRDVPLPNGLVMPFAAVVPVDADAPLIDRIVAWNGRDPHWR